MNTKETDDEQTLQVTEEAVARFCANRNQATYSQAVHDFVLEAMATQRHAYFPVDVKQLMQFLEGGSPCSFVCLRDSEGVLYTVFLTSRRVPGGPAEASVGVVASKMLINVMQDPALGGVVINPYSDGGLRIPKQILAQVMVQLNAEFGASEN